jgi:hypothetical protein
MTDPVCLDIASNDCRLHQTGAWVDRSLDGIDTTNEVSLPREPSGPEDASNIRSNDDKTISESPNSVQLEICDQLTFQSPTPSLCPGPIIISSTTGHPPASSTFGTSGGHEMGTGGSYKSGQARNHLDRGSGLFDALYSPSWGLPGPKSPRKYTYAPPYDIDEGPNTTTSGDSNSVSPHLALGPDPTVSAPSGSPIAIPDAPTQNTQADGSTSGVSSASLDTAIPVINTPGDPTSVVANTSSPLIDTSPPLDSTTSHDVNFGGVGMAKDSSTAVSNDQGNQLDQSQELGANGQDPVITVANPHLHSDASESHTGQAQRKKRKLADISNECSTSQTETPKGSPAKKSRVPVPDSLCVSTRRSKRSQAPTSVKSVSKPVISKGKGKSARAKVKPGWDLVERGQTPPPTKLPC